MFNAVLALVLGVTPIGVEEISSSAFAALGSRIANREHFEHWRGIVDPTGDLNRFFELRPDRILLRYDRSSAPVSVAFGARLHRVQQRDPLPVARAESQNLSGLRIVVDPGHRGGAWSRIEQRHIRAGPGPAVREGDLTYATAVQLRDFLVNAGAEVLLTRAGPQSRRFPAGAFDGYDVAEETQQWVGELVHNERWQPFHPWLKGWVGQTMARVMARWLPEIAPFKLYNRYELRARSKIAGRFSPHLTVSLHYNMSSDRLHNGVITFIPGNFVGAELSTASQRYYAFRKLVAGDMSLMAEVARTVSRAMIEELETEVLNDLPSDPAGVARKMPIFPDDGVFARNLSLLRRTEGPVLLIEGPCMNAVGEFPRLQGRDLEVDGRPAPYRTRQYAIAVFRAIASHADQLRR